MKTERIVLAKRPEGIPSNDVFKYETVEVGMPDSEEIQIETL